MEYGSSEVRKVPNLTQRWPHPDLTILTEKIERKAIPLDILRQTPHSTDRPPRFRRLPRPGSAESGRFPAGSGTPRVGPSATVAF